MLHWSKNCNILELKVVNCCQKESKSAFSPTLPFLTRSKSHIRTIFLIIEHVTRNVASFSQCSCGRNMFWPKIDTFCMLQNCPHRPKRANDKWTIAVMVNMNSGNSLRQACYRRADGIKRCEKHCTKTPAACNLQPCWADTLSMQDWRAYCFVIQRVKMDWPWKGLCLAIEIRPWCLLNG